MMYRAQRLTLKLLQTTFQRMATASDERTRLLVHLLHQGAKLRQSLQTRPKHVRQIVEPVKPRRNKEIVRLMKLVLSCPYFRNELGGEQDEIFGEFRYNSSYKTLNGQRSLNKRHSNPRCCADRI